MKNYMGSVIKKLREINELTQKELSEGICTIRQLSRIELNLSSPSFFILKEISYRLGNDLFEYIPYSTDENVFEIKNEIEIIEKKFNSQQYKEALNLILQSEVLNSTKCTYSKQETAWLIGALNNYIEVPYEINKDYYINLLKCSLDFNEIDEVFDVFLKPPEYRIINSLIVLYLTDEDYEVGERLLINAIKSFEKNHTSINDTSYIKFLYNLSRLYFQTNRFEEAKEVSSKGVIHSKNNSSFTHLAGLCNIYGRSLYELGFEDEGKEYIKNYIHLSRFVNPDYNYEDVISKLNKDYNLELNE